MNIHTAAQRGNLNRVKALVNQGVNVNLRNNENMTPLMHAAFGGHANVIRFLLSRGANAKARMNSVNRNALIFAVEKGNANAVRALLRHSNLSVQNANGRSALTTAANLRHPEIVRMLVRAGARPNNATHEYLRHNSNDMKNLIGNMLIRRAIAKRAVPRMLEAKASRRNLAMRQQLGGVMVREGNKNVKGLPPVARNLIGLMMRRKKN